MFQVSPTLQPLLDKVESFVQECIAAEADYFKTVEASPWTIPPVVEELKTRAKALGLWNLFLPKTYKESPGLTNLEYAMVCEILGKSPLAPEATNTNAPDTGNMEMLAKYGTEQQKRDWLVPLMDGRIRSAFAMTEPDVASSDATNIQTSIVLDGNDYVINGRKWWISGAGDPRCKVFFVMGKTNTNEKIHRQQSVVIVPRDTPGITILRPMKVFGYDDAPHGHMELDFKNVRVPKENIIFGPGKGFEVVQGRLGPGRIHHCMRAIGVAERVLELHKSRILSRKAFGKLIGQHALAATQVAESRCDIDASRLLVYQAAAKMDAVGPKKAMKYIAMAKYTVPKKCCQVLDRAIQAFGAAGVSQDYFLAQLYAMMRTLRIADGPDEVHLLQLSKLELVSNL